MAKHRYALVLDVGTTGAKAFVFADGKNGPSAVSKAYAAYPVTSPKPGWVEQDPRRLLMACVRVLRNAVADGGIDAKDIESFGITNQRETTILWDSKTMKPVYPAIVWQDRRTARRCAALGAGTEKLVRTVTGLTLDPYFSASKIEWILRNVKESRPILDVGRLRFGTVDAWLLANLCTGSPHATDETNAARTLLFNIRTRAWDPELCAIFGVPERILPAVLPPRADFGALRPDIVGAPLPVSAVIGDQQSSFYAAVALSKSRPTTKVTYGTGTFVIQSLGNAFSVHRDSFTTLVPTPNGKTAYALEAKVGVSGPEVQKRLRYPKKLEQYLRKLAKDVDRRLKRLPVRPKTIFIDGGITRSPLLAPIQQEISRIKVKALPTYDGTALGVAMMLLGK
jgi:glycerol kinase